MLRVVYCVWCIWLCVFGDVHYLLRIVNLCIMRCVMHMMGCVYFIVLYHGVLCSVQCVFRILVMYCMLHCVLCIAIVFATVRIVCCVL